MRVCVSVYEFIMREEERERKGGREGENEERVSVNY